MSLKSTNTNSTNRSGGPRTVHGKARSSQNSLKHTIFVPRVLPDEENTAAVLSDAVQDEFHLKGAMELKLGRDLVQSELEAQRIEIYANQQVAKAQVFAKLETEQFGSAHTSILRYPTPKEKISESGYGTCFRPAICISYLLFLKNQIEKYGLRPDEDLALLDLIYRDQLSPFGVAIVSRYKMLIANERLNKMDEQATERRRQDNTRYILEDVEKEVKYQEGKLFLEDERDTLEWTLDWMVFPPDQIFDRIEKYRTANSRKFGRLLNNLETIRRLKAQT